MRQFWSLVMITISKGFDILFVDQFHVIKMISMVGCICSHPGSLPKSRRRIPIHFSNLEPVTCLGELRVLRLVGSQRALGAEISASLKAIQKRSRIVIRPLFQPKMCYPDFNVYEINSGQLFMRNVSPVYVRPISWKLKVFTRMAHGYKCKLAQWVSWKLFFEMFEAQKQSDQDQRW